MSNKNKSLTKNVDILCFDIGGTGIKCAIYKINPILKIPVLSSNIIKFNIKKEENLDKMSNNFEKILKKNCFNKCNIFSVSNGKNYKIYTNWMNFSIYEKENSINIIKYYASKHKKSYFENNDRYSHYIGCSIVNGILNKNISTFNLIFGTSPCIYITDNYGKEIKNSGNLVKNYNNMFESQSLKNEFGAYRYKNIPDNFSINNKNMLDDYNEDNKLFFNKICNIIIKPIFLSNKGSKYFNKWTLNYPPKYIFFCGGMVEWKLAGYVPIINKWLKSKSTFLKDTNVMLAPSNSALIGSSVYPYM
tara:strand:- start:95 stop:1006 length:912 start_codon:yes stop_codon:yes gene_type:complete